jgi:hypothetical protein
MRLSSNFLANKQLASKPLANKRSGQYQYQKQQYGFEVPAGCNARHEVLTLEFFPTLPNHCRCSTGVASGEIPWANGASKIGGFGQKSTLITGSEKSRVATWSSSSPCHVFFFTNKQGQGISSIDSAYCTPRNVVSSNHINDSNSTLIYFNPGQPKQNQNYINQKRNYRQRANRRGDSLIGDAGDKGQAHYEANEYGYDPAKPRLENLHEINLALGVIA